MGKRNIRGRVAESLKPILGDPDSWSLIESETPDFMILTVPDENKRQKAYRLLASDSQLHNVSMFGTQIRFWVSRVSFMRRWAESLNWRTRTHV